MNKIAKIVQMNKKVFTAQDLAVWWNYVDERKLYELIKYYVAKGDIKVLTRGLYTLQKYTEEEIRGDIKLLFAIANKLMPSSYVSLFTVLKMNGLINQYYNEVYSVAGRSMVRTVLGVRFVYKQVKAEILLNDNGIVNDLGVRMASLERAVADTWYVYPRLNLENLEQVDKDKLGKILKVYGKKVMFNKLKEIERR